MAYGISKGNEHIYTFDDEEPAKRMASRMGSEFYARELTIEEYHERLHEIVVEGKYSPRKNKAPN